MCRQKIRRLYSKKIGSVQYYYEYGSTNSEVQDSSISLKYQSSSLLSVPYQFNFNYTYINQMQYYLVVILLLSVSLSQDCQGCNADGCIIFYGGNNCSSCQANFYLNSSSNQCIACPQNQISFAGSTSVSDCFYSCSMIFGCSTCINSTSCNFCSQNYYMIGNGICSQCPAGQYTPPNNTLPNCPACANLCYYCSSTSNDCLSCPADYYLDSTNSTCVPCLPGTYLYEQQSEPSCDSCIQSSCQTCSGLYSVVNCTTCPAYSYLFIMNQLNNGGLIFSCTPCFMGQYTPPGNTLTSCLQCPLPYCDTCNSTACLACPNGYYLNGLQCTPCVFPCQSCTNYSVCLACISPGTLNGTSCVICPCQDCSTSCQCCSDDPNCYLCAQNGSCLTCMNQYYFYSYLCIPCPSFCIYCLNQNTCTACRSGYYLYEDLCYGCPASMTTFGFIITQTFCCSKNCSSCLNNMTCLTCASNYYLTQGSMCTPCPYGLTTEKGNTNTTCSLACPTGCSSCIIDNGPCLTCLGVYYLTCDTGYCYCAYDSSNDTNNNSGSGLSQSTIIVLSTVIPICVLVIIGIIVYCVIKKKKQSTIGATDKPRTSDVEIGDRKYTKLTQTNLAVQ